MPVPYIKKKKNPCKQCILKKLFDADLSISILYLLMQWKHLDYWRLEGGSFFFGFMKPIGFCGMWFRMICKPLWLSGVVFKREKPPLCIQEISTINWFLYKDKNWVFGVTVESRRIWGYHDTQRCAYCIDCSRE
jgi:hypothetical protein